jgi:hypothetical protein
MKPKLPKPVIMLVNVAAYVIWVRNTKYNKKCDINTYGKLYRFSLFIKSIIMG